MFFFRDLSNTSGRLVLKFTTQQLNNSTTQQLNNLRAVREPDNCIVSRH